jgi:hypothetical protein
MLVSSIVSLLNIDLKKKPIKGNNLFSSNNMLFGNLFVNIDVLLSGGIYKTKI